MFVVGGRCCRCNSGRLQRPAPALCKRQPVTLSYRHFESALLKCFQIGPRPRAAKGLGAGERQLGDAHQDVLQSEASQSEHTHSSDSSNFGARSSREPLLSGWPSGRRSAEDHLISGHIKRPPHATNGAARPAPECARCHSICFKIFNIQVI